jgi:hypothetical protein
MKQLIIPVLLLMIVLGACKKNSDSAVPDTHGNFMFVNAAPGNLQFDILLDTINFASSVKYGDIVGYKSYRAQKYNLIITKPGDPKSVYFTKQVFLRNNRYYSAYLSADSALQNYIVLITEDNLTSLGPGTAKFRVLNSSQAFQPNRAPYGMDIRLNVNLKNPALTDTTSPFYRDTFPRFFSSLYYPSLTDFIPLYKDSAYQMMVNPIDLRANANPTVLKAFPFPAAGMRTQEGKVYTLITTGYPLDPARFNTIIVTHN